jgi:hypothetical protein
MRASIKSGLIALMLTGAAVLHSINLPQQTMGSNARQTRIYSSCWTASPSRGTDTISTRCCP